jgi:Septum formation
VLGFVNGTCNPIVSAYSGLASGDARVLAPRLAMFWFLPTEAEFADGARWIRCDAAITPVGDETVTILKTLRGRLSSVQLPLGGFGQTAAKGSIPNELVVCSPSSNEEFVLYVACDEPHLWEAAFFDQNVFASVGAFDEVALKAAAETLCGDDILGNDAATAGNTPAATGIDLAPGWRIPTANSWESGDRMVWCTIESINGQPYTGSWLGTDSTVVGL